MRPFERKATAHRVGEVPAWQDKDVARFWSKVDRRTADECWPWIGARTTGEYGVFSIGETLIKAHRFSFTLNVGPIPEGLFILHGCDNPPCVNPAHLSTGDYYDNATAMFQRGRFYSQARPDLIPRGSANGQAKLSESDVLEIRRRYSERGISTYGLAREFNVSRPLIGYIINRKIWTHI